MHERQVVTLATLVNLRTRVDVMFQLRRKTPLDATHVCVSVPIQRARLIRIPEEQRGRSSLLASLRRLLGSYADLALRGFSLKSSRAVLAIFSLICGQHGRRGLPFSWRASDDAREREDRCQKFDGEVLVRLRPWSRQ